MEFSFLKFWVPSFFVLNKTEREATLSLILSEFTDSNLVLFSTLKQILKYELILQNVCTFIFYIYICVVKLLPERKILTNYQCVHKEGF